jgi:O-antigen/teichoic acid export membrane protein
VADVAAFRAGTKARPRRFDGGAGPLGHAGRRLPALLTSRVVEQCVLGGASLLLAARLGLDAFAPVSALLVVNSAAVTLSDYGIGLAALRCAPGERVALRSLHRMRLANLALLVLGVAVGFAVGGDVGTLIAASGAIWCASAEAFVRKAASIASGHGRQAAAAELMGSVVFAVPVVAIATGSRALAVVGAALVLKHVVELAVARGGRTMFAADGVKPALRSLCTTQVLAYGLGNIDYVIVAAVLGAAAFSVYTLAYRVAVAVPSVVAYVATRTAVSDFSTARHDEERQARYSRYVRPLFAIGVGSAIVAAGIGVVLPSVLGAQWDAVAPAIAVLAFAAPWRMIAGQAGALAIADGAEGRLVRWELARLAVFAVLFSAAAMAGFGVFLATVTAGWIVGVTVLHRLATRRAGLHEWGALVPLAALATVGAAVVAAWTVVQP